MEEVNKKLEFLDEGVKKSPIDEKTKNIKTQFLEESFISLNGYHDNEEHDRSFDIEIESLFNELDRENIQNKYNEIKPQIVESIKKLTNRDIKLSDDPISSEYLVPIRLALMTVHVNTESSSIKTLLNNMYKQLFQIYRSVQINKTSVNFVVFELFNKLLFDDLMKLKDETQWNNNWIDIKPLDFRANIGPMERTLQSSISNYFQSLYKEELDHNDIKIGTSHDEKNIENDEDGRISALYRMTGIIKATYKYMLRNSINFKIIGAYKDALDSADHIKVTNDQFTKFIVDGTGIDLQNKDAVDTYNKLLFINMDEYFKTNCDSSCVQTINESFLEKEWQNVVGHGILFLHSTESKRKEIGDALKHFYIYKNDEKSNDREIILYLPISLILDVIHDILPKLTNENLGDDVKSNLESILTMIFGHIKDNLHNYSEIFESINRSNISRNEPMDIFTFIKLRVDKDRTISDRYSIDTSKTNLLKVGYLNDSKNYYAPAFGKNAQRNDRKINKNIRENFYIEANRVFKPETTNEEIVNSTQFKKIIDDLSIGRSTTIMMYGTSGSGKTSTMIMLKFPNKKMDPIPGIIPELLKKLNMFDSIELRLIEFQRNTETDKLDLSGTSSNNVEWFRSDRDIPKNEMEYDGEHSGILETEWDMRKYFYSHQIFKRGTDNQYTTTQARTQKHFGENHEEYQKCSNYFEEKLDNDYELGEYLHLILNTQRVTKATPLNWKSSRSHMIISLGLIKDGKIESRLNICDLAGVESDYECGDKKNRNENLMQKLRNIKDPEDDSKMAYDNIIEEVKKNKLGDMNWMTQESDKKMDKKENDNLTGEELDFNVSIRDYFKNAKIDESVLVKISNTLNRNFNSWVRHLLNIKIEKNNRDGKSSWDDQKIKGKEIKNLPNIYKRESAIETELSEKDNTLLRKEQIFKTFYKKKESPLRDIYHELFFVIAFKYYFMQNTEAANIDMHNTSITDLYKDDVYFKKIMRGVMQVLKPRPSGFGPDIEDLIKKWRGEMTLPKIYFKIVKYNIAAYFDNDILFDECVKRTKEGEFINQSLGIMSIALNAVLKNKKRIPDAESLCIPIQCNSIWGDCFSDVDTTLSASQIDPIGSIIESLERMGVGDEKEIPSSLTKTDIMNNINFGIFNVVNMTAPYVRGEKGNPMPKDPFSVPFIDYSRFMLEINRIKSRKNLMLFPKIRIDGSDIDVIPEEFMGQNIHPNIVYDLTMRITKHYIDRHKDEKGFITSLDGLAGITDHNTTDVGWDSSQISDILSALKEVFKNNNYDKYSAVINVAFLDSILTNTDGTDGINVEKFILNFDGKLEWPIKDSNNFNDKNKMDELRYKFLTLSHYPYVKEHSENSIAEAIKFIGMLDIYTASNPMSTLTFIDSMTKYGAVRTTCSFGSAEDIENETYAKNMKSIYLKNMEDVLKKAMR